MNKKMTGALSFLCAMTVLFLCACSKGGGSGFTAESTEAGTAALSTQEAASGPEKNKEDGTGTAALTDTETQTESAEGTDCISEKKEITELKIGSYNIKHAADGGCEAIAGVIVSAGLDICGLQEVDYRNTRSNNEDQVKLIAEAAGMPYYKFTKAISYRGGYYGTAILSKYPIEDYTLTQLYAGEEEGRSVGKAVIDVNGTKLDFYCTHLSYESVDLRKVQFKTLAKMLSGSENFILVADFNTEDFSEFAVLGDVYMVNSDAHRYVTFPGHSSAIDNIIMSKNLRGEFDSVVTGSFSDHYMLTAKAYIGENE